ncbi:MAG: family 16 glycosylhydrolase [Planctomycetota bacterium]
MMIRPHAGVILCEFVCLCLCVWTSHPAQAGEFTVCTYNIRMNSAGDGEDVWPNRVDTVAELIATQDVIGLQEVTPVQLADLIARLADHSHFGVGREDGKSLGEHAVVFFRTNRFELQDRSTFWLSEDPSEVGSKGWDAAIPRTVTQVRLRDKKDGRTYRIANAHFDHRGRVARRESAALIVKRLTDPTDETPVIFMGDLNCTPDSKPYKTLVRAGWSDARTLHPLFEEGGISDQGAVEREGDLSSADSTWNGFKQIVPGRIIDHIFLSGPVEWLDFRIEDPKTPSGRFASDHLPVIARVRFATPESVRPNPPSGASPSSSAATVPTDPVESDAERQDSDRGNATGLRLIWSDEFDGREIDRTRWKAEVNAFGGGNQELQIYTDRPKNVRVEGGRLILEAHRETVDLMGTVRKYSSARMSTKHRGDFLYGRVEVRAKLPKGNGLWPAIWMLPTDDVYGPWAAGGEIDIMEMRGSQPSTVLGTLHHGGQWPNNEQSGGEFTLRSGSFADDFHVFAVDWRRGAIDWFVDGELVQSQTDWTSSGGPYPAPFDQRFHVLLNLAVGGRFVAKEPDQTTAFPARMEVDYVRVYH